MRFGEVCTHELSLTRTLLLPPLRDVNFRTSDSPSVCNANNAPTDCVRKHVTKLLKTRCTLSDNSTIKIFETDHLTSEGKLELFEEVSDSRLPGPAMMRRGQL